MTRSPSAIPKLFALGAALLGAVLLAAPAEAKRISLASLLARIAALETQTAAQQTQIDQLQVDLAVETAARQAADAALQDLIDTFPADSVPGLQAQIDALQAESVPRLAEYVSVVDRLRDIDGDGDDDEVPTVLIEGANVQIVDGNGRTIPIRGNRPSGLGNLIVGYDEKDFSGRAKCSDGQHLTQEECELEGEIWAANQKNGAHNLVVGRWHFYSQAGGAVMGTRNFINGETAVVSGGHNNTASDWASSVSGGSQNTASGGFSSVSGGRDNTASGGISSVSGGIFNTASGSFSSVSGGQENTSGGSRASVSGGNFRSAPNTFNWAAGGLFQNE